MLTQHSISKYLVEAATNMMMQTEKHLGRGSVIDQWLVISQEPCIKYLKYWIVRLCLEQS